MKIDSELRRKVKVILTFRTGVMPRSTAILVLMGEKPATEMYMPNKEDAPEAARVLCSLGVHAEVSRKERRFQDDSADVLVAGSAELLERLRETYSWKNPEEYGRLMGYPQTAIDAFLGRRQQHVWSEDDPLYWTREVSLGHTFVMSKEFMDVEVEVRKRHLRLLALYAPELFHMLSRQHGKMLLEMAKDL